MSLFPGKVKDGSVGYRLVTRPIEPFLMVHRKPSNLLVYKALWLTSAAFNIINWKSDRRRCPALSVWLTIWRSCENESCRFPPQISGLSFCSDIIKLLQSPLHMSLCDLRLCHVHIIMWTCVCVCVCDSWWDEQPDIYSTTSEISTLQRRQLAQQPDVKPDIYSRDSLQLMESC